MIEYFNFLLVYIKSIVFITGPDLWHELKQRKIELSVFV
jgi:hypothetical protein